MFLFAFDWRLLKIPKFWTYEIPTWKNLGPMKYPQEKSSDPQNTREKKRGTHEILTQKYFGPTKYPREKTLDPRNIHEKEIWTYEIPTRKTLDPQNTSWGKTQMLKKNYADKINGTKNALLLLSRAPIQNSFTFNLWFLYELKHKACLSKPGSGIFHFRFRFVFVKVYIFAQQNAWTLWL